MVELWRLEPGVRRASARRERRGECERCERDAEHVVQVEPEEQRVAAEERSEERSRRVPRVEQPGGVSELARAPSQLVEEERQRRAGEGDRERQDEEQAREDVHVEGHEGGGVVAKQDA